MRQPEVIKIIVGDMLVTAFVLQCLLGLKYEYASSVILNR